MYWNFGANDLIYIVPDPSAVPNGLYGSYSAFDQELKKLWQAASDQGVCRYQLQTSMIETKILPGKYNFVSKFHPNRSALRRKPQTVREVNVPFDPQQFNFNKVDHKEILMKLAKKNNNVVSDNLILVNVSPIDFGNCLLVPGHSKNIRQKATLEGLELLINTMLLSNDPNLRASFSSPGAYSSVNHQHYHLYYLKERLFVESMNVQHLSGPCYAMMESPSKGFAFQLEKDPAQLAKNVFTLARYLRKNNMAHNIYFTRGKHFTNATADVYDTLRVFVWAREPMFDAGDDIPFYPTAAEFAGHLTIKDPSVFGGLTDEMVASILEGETLKWFERVVPAIPELYPSNKEMTS